MGFTGGCNVSSTILHPRPQKPQEADWSRLIPGVVPTFSPGARKPVQSVKRIVHDEAAHASAHPASVSETAMTFLLPAPLHGPMAGRWARSAAADVALVGLDWLLLGALLVPMRRAFPQVHLFGYAAGRPFALLGIAALHAVLIVMIGHAEGLHGASTPRPRILFKSVLWATIVLSFGYGLQGAAGAAGVLIWVAGLLHCASLLAWRWQVSRQTYDADNRINLRRVLIVGAGGVGRRLASHIEGNPEAGRSLYGILDDTRPLGKGVIGRVADLARLARTGFVDEVILAALHDRFLMQQVLHEARRLRLDVKLVPEVFGCISSLGEVERVGDLPVISLHAERSPSLGLVLKRVVDVIGAVAALVFLLPLLLAIACLIKLDSRGTIFYRAQRVGRKGRLFRCYKFRTMVRDADQLKGPLRQNNQRSGPCFKIVGDPRITRLGRLLRRYSLDELPQFWNVVKGDMSLVGPRPHPVDDFAAYEIEHLSRLDVTPGITGLWQVTARKDPSFERGMALDREYIRTWSLGMDMRILLRTVIAVVQGSGD
jgi:exopolysaccharide biosynthesis polyprenyl glycosylphosphotransferase